MYVTTWNDAAFSCQFEFVDQVLQQTGIHRALIHKSDRFASTSTFQSLLKLFHQIQSYLLIHVDLGILGDFKYAGFELVVFGMREDYRQVEPNHILKEHDGMRAGFGGQLNETSHGFSGYLDQGELFLVSVFFVPHHDTEVQTLVTQIRELRNVFDHQGDDIRTHHLVEIMSDKCALFGIQLFLVDQINPFLV